MADVVIDRREIDRASVKLPEVFGESRGATNPIPARETYGGSRRSLIGAVDRVRGFASNHPAFARVAPRIARLASFVGVALLLSQTGLLRTLLWIPFAIFG